MSKSVVNNLALKATFLALHLSCFALAAEATSPNPPCLASVSRWTVSGQSMSELYRDREQVDVDLNYFKCQGPRRGQDVLFRVYASQKFPLIKRIVAVAGDQFSAEPVPGTSFFRVRIGGEILKTPRGHEYRLSSHRAKILSRFAKESEGKLGPDTVLVFGTSESGSQDSSLFGPIRKSALLGRVMGRRSQLPR